MKEGVINSRQLLVQMVLNVVTIRFLKIIWTIIFCLFLFPLPVYQRIKPRCEKQWDVCLSTIYIKLHYIGQPKATRNRGLLTSDKISICHQGGVKVEYWYKIICWRCVHQLDRNLCNCHQPYQYFALQWILLSSF